MYTKFLEKIKLDLNDLSPSPTEILSNYPEANDFDKCVILLRSYKWTYGQISSKLGSPSKKAIRASLVKWAPELIEEDCNRNKLKAKERASKEEFILINFVKIIILLMTTFNILCNNFCIVNKVIVHFYVVDFFLWINLQHLGRQCSVFQWYFLKFAFFHILAPPQIGQYTPISLSKFCVFTFTLQQSIFTNS